MVLSKKSLNASTPTLLDTLPTLHVNELNATTIFNISHLKTSIGRLPILTHLDPLDRDALLRVLTEPKNAIIRQYKKLFEMDNVSLTFAPDALELIVDKAIEFKLGARGLRSIVESIMIDAMYDIPSANIKEFEVTRQYAVEKLQAANFDTSVIK